MTGSKCAFANCKTYKNRYKGLSFHKLPLRRSNNAWRSELIRIINRHDVNFNPDRATICSRHYEEDCFMNFNSGARRLKEGSLPTLYLNDDCGPESIPSDHRPMIPAATKPQTIAPVLNKKEQASNQGRISISAQFSRWQKVRDSLHLRSHSEVAEFLLDWYFTHQDCYQMSPNSGMFEPMPKAAEILASNDVSHNSMNNLDYTDYQAQKKADLFLGGQDIQVFDTTSNELVFRTSLQRPSINHSRKAKQRRSFTITPYVPTVNYPSSSDEDQEEPVAENTDPTYLPSTVDIDDDNSNTHLRRRSRRLRHWEDGTEQLDENTDFKLDVSEEISEKLVEECPPDDKISEEKCL